jgi:hypothetical protein
VQTLVQAVHLAHTGKSRLLAKTLRYLDGQDEGSDAANISQCLPDRHDRTYTLTHFVTAAYEVVDGVYRTRDASEALEAAVVIECESAAAPPDECPWGLTERAVGEYAELLGLAPAPGTDEWQRVEDSLATIAEDCVARKSPNQVDPSRTDELAGLLCYRHRPRGGIDIKLYVDDSVEPHELVTVTPGSGAGLRTNRKNRPPKRVREEQRRRGG